MSDAYKCDECGQFDTTPSAGSLTLEVTHRSQDGPHVATGSYTKVDLCPECTMTLYQAAFDTE